MQGALSQRESTVKAQNLPRPPGGRVPETNAAELLPFGHGRYQVVCLLNSVLAGATLFYHLFTVRLTTQVMDHWCRPPDAFANLSAAEWKELAIPLEEDGSRSRCTRRDPPDAGDDANVLRCREWDFDYSYHGYNVVSEWQLVCERSWLLVVSYYIYFTSSVIWLPVLGRAADRVGRKIVVTLSAPPLIISSFGSVLTRSFLFFSTMRLVMSATTAALAVVLLVVLYEATESSHRATFCIGSLALSFMCSIVPFLIVAHLQLDWQTCYLVLMVPTSLHVALFYTVDESYRWLMATWHTKAAERVALRAAQMNDASLDHCWAAMGKAVEVLPVHDVNGDTAVKRQRASSIFSKELIGRSLLLSYIWSTFNFAYTLTILSGAFPLNAAASLVGASFILPLFAVCYWAVCHVGVKATFSACSLVISVASLLLAGTHAALEGTFLATALVLSLRVAITVNVSLCLYLPLLCYPTKARCMGLSFSFAVGRLVGNTGELLMRHYAPDQLLELGAAIQGALLALAAVATQFLPDLSAEERCAKAPSTQSSRKEGFIALQNTLVPLPKGPVRRHKQ
ncbi:solute carrier family 22 member 7-like [Amblyomma americanum]